MAADHHPATVPDQRTLALVNTYIVSIARMLNEFSASCETSLSKVQTSLQAAETRLSLLEAQLAHAAADTVTEGGADQPANGLRDLSSPTESAEAAQGAGGADVAELLHGEVSDLHADSAAGHAAAAGGEYIARQHGGCMSPSEQAADGWTPRG